MKTKNIYKPIIASMLLLVTACDGMDEVYKDYIGDGPIVYLQVIDPEKVKIHSGRERVEISLPETTDPRIDYTTISWANGSYSQKIPVTYKEPASVILNENLPEGLYDFVLINHSDNGLYSISSSVIGETFGEVYESYLRNRNIQRIEQEMSSKNTTIHFPMLSDSIIQGTEIKWAVNGTEKTKLYPNTEDNQIELGAFPLDDDNNGQFQYRAQVLPNADAIDNFYSPWQTVRFKVVEEIAPAFIAPADWTFVTSHKYIPEGSNGAPELLTDGDPKKFFTLRKPGGGRKDGDGNVIPETDKIWFTIDLKETEKFDFLEWYHRGGNTSLGLRAWAVALYGSNDGISFTQIGEDSYKIPGYNDGGVAKDKIEFPESGYRFLKVEVTEWDTVNNSAIQVGEFKLGYSKVPTGLGIGVIQ